MCLGNGRLWLNHFSELYKNEATRCKNHYSRQPVVQMSHAWIKRNLPAEVGPKLAKEIATGGPLKGPNYSRHLFYTPLYLPSALEHEQALLAGNPEDHTRHSDHSIPPTHRYNDAEIEAAVQAKARVLKAKKTP